MALVLKESLLNYAEYAVWKIEEEPEFYRSKLILSEWETNYLAAITHPKRQLTWLASRYLLKFLMNTDEFVELLFDEHGKPYVTNFDLHVSLSHSFTYAAAIFGNDTLTNIANGTADIFLARIDSSAHGTITGINSPGDNIQSIKVFPNPVHTNCTIHTEVKLHDATLNVYNVYGQVVLQMNHLSGNQFRIQRDQLQSGVLFLELEEAGLKIGIGNLIVE